MTITADQIAFIMASLALASAVFTAGMHVATLRRLGRDMDKVVSDMAKVAALTVQVHEHNKSLDELWKELRDYRGLPTQVRALEEEIKRVRDSLHKTNNHVTRMLAKSGLLEE